MDRLPELAVALIAAAFAAAMAGCAMPASETESPTIEHANGCPLDAVAYDAPAFANHDSKALKVVDRTSGASWWLVKMGRSWVALPIEGKEVENAG